METPGLYQIIREIHWRNMHKKINKVKKDVDKAEKDLKSLKKADIKQDKIVDKAKKMKGKC